MSLTWMSLKLHVRHLYYSEKNRIISADTHSLNLGTSHFFSWLLLGKKDITKPRPGWRGPKDSNFHYKISYTVGLTIVTRRHITSSWKWKSLGHVQLFVTPWTLQFVELLPAMRETWVWSLGWEDLLEKGMATHPSILAWRVPWVAESDTTERLSWRCNVQSGDYS